LRKSFHKDNNAKPDPPTVAQQTLKEKRQLKKEKALR
jgi:hypothetical protein